MIQKPRRGLIYVLISDFEMLTFEFGMWTLVLIRFTCLFFAEYIIHIYLISVWAFPLLCSCWPWAASSPAPRPRGQSCWPHPRHQSWRSRGRRPGNIRVKVWRRTKWTQSTGGLCSPRRRRGSRREDSPWRAAPGRHFPTTRRGDPPAFTLTAAGATSPGPRASACRPSWPASASQGRGATCPRRPVAAWPRSEAIVSQTTARVSWRPRQRLTRPSSAPASSTASLKARRDPADHIYRTRWTVFK